MKTEQLNKQEQQTISSRNNTGTNFHKINSKAETLDSNNNTINNNNNLNKNNSTKQVKLSRLYESVIVPKPVKVLNKDDLDAIKFKVS